MAAKTENEDKFLIDRTFTTEQIAVIERAGKDIPEFVQEINKSLLGGKHSIDYYQGMLAGLKCATISLNPLLSLEAARGCLASLQPTIAKILLDKIRNSN